MAGQPMDFELVLRTLPVTYHNGSLSTATSEGNNAAWNCMCGQLLIGRCYYQFGDTCYTICPSCRKKYRVTRDAKREQMQ